MRKEDPELRKIVEKMVDESKSAGYFRYLDHIITRDLTPEEREHLIDLILEDDYGAIRKLPFIQVYRAID
ncbi:hypothetical protein SAMN05443662_1426 [Sulfurivirga caldicuralii]|uniref:Uncharacterized protein n=1 Tax=Sulfurivirga caldicuralii TaxID=364032 RepID=A0A1N6GNK2_9GAMM|nr:hypothetical protein [Sulfurivirga caldicuralii]SIO09129.1 hypothetical protein SAMN05443662_1426 [Sulfurivirga caldicuralii]